MSDTVHIRPTSPAHDVRVIRHPATGLETHRSADEPTVITRGVKPLAGHGSGRLHHFFESACDATPDAIALECDGERITYGELDNRANRLANGLRATGLWTGARAGVLLNRSVNLYVALLAVQKANATLVPIDPASPADRVSFIAEDSDLALILSSSDLCEIHGAASCPVVALDVLGPALATAPATRPAPGGGTDPSCYIIYTSGSTGRPKGVEVAQSSICNYLEVVPEIYGIRPSDRVYQGMTVAFDFSIEEIWLTWASGATVVAGPRDSRRIGPGLATFLTSNGITVLYCVPTVLATIDRELPLVRALVVGGETCPPELVERWSKPSRRMFNTYGPTETTITATWVELRPGRPVTIGRPLPTYHVRLLDENQQAVPVGQIGEICVGGVGVARGYVNRPELTAERFLADDSVPGGRLYRTGDLGRLTPDGEIEYHGRADSEVKVRGHRIDLGEIESVLLTDDEVGGAAVALRSEPGADAALVAYVTCPSGSADVTALRDRLAERLHERLPHYMVPAFLEILPALPLMPSGKVDRKVLPPPQSKRLVRASASHAVPETEGERKIAEVWARVFGVDIAELSVTADFFTDLGGHSLLAARAASALRQTDFAGSLSVADLYAYPSVRELAKLIDNADVKTVRLAKTHLRWPGPRHRRRPHRRRVLPTGVMQLLIGYLLLLVVGTPGAAVIGAGGGTVTASQLWDLGVVVAASVVVGRWALPVVGVRLLSIGLRPGRYPLWSRTHLRVWTIQALMAVAPFSTLSGSPMMAPYLRLLGARVGKDCHIATAALPTLLPAMLYLGDGVSIGYNAQLPSSYVEHGWVTVKPVTVRDNAFIGANAVVQAGAELGHGAALADLSLAAEDQIIPAGEQWSGSPAARAPRADPLLEELGRRPRPERGWSLGHRIGFAIGLSALEVLTFVLLAPGLVFGGWALLAYGPLTATAAVALTGPVYVVMTCLVVAAGKKIVLPRTPTGVHPIASGAGLRKWFADKLFQTSLTTTNSLYSTLYAAPWLRLLGARVGKRSEVSTAAHLDPDLLTLGTESFIADMASVGSATYHNGHLATGRTVVGDRSFVGNAALLRSGTVIGRSALLGVHSTAPVDGLPHGTDWLGSPAIRLPRREESESFGDELTYRPSRGRVAERLVIEFFRIVLPGTILGLAAYLFLLSAEMVAGRFGVTAEVFLVPVLASASGLVVVLTVAALKWLVVGRYRPRVEPLWSRFVRRSEFITALYEAAAVPAMIGPLAGTPWIAPLLRLFGVRIGKRTWLGTTFLSEFDLVHIGDDVAVGPATSLQTHLFEDRVMKMSTIDIESGVSIGARTVVLYDTTVGSGATIDPLSLVMKGEHLPAATRWRGIPSRAVH
ncbi:Pls/PosA family non-ribosomal peptide synthetase [Amycolatopsis pigmentata]|uniref:Pls/PosA family non-ribosomal peptide synthetase n=1 Tax=Amycolatopsis pigmentata TaxID=450801 RepID=A0ABW5G1N0_9PSEU